MLMRDVADVGEVEYILACWRRDRQRHPIREEQPHETGTREFYRERVDALCRFINTEFDRNDERSWKRLDSLYRAALMSRDLANEVKR